MWSRDVISTRLWRGWNCKSHGPPDGPRPFSALPVGEKPQVQSLWGPLAHFSEPEKTAAYLAEVTG